MTHKKRIIWMIVACLGTLSHFNPALSDSYPDMIRVQTTGHPVRIFSSEFEECQAPCEVNLNGEGKFMLFSDDSELLKRQRIQDRAMDFGIVHLPNSNIPSSIEVPFPIHSTEYRMGVFCNEQFGAGCSVITDQAKGSSKKIWKDSEYPDEKVIDLILAPDRKHYLIITEQKAFLENAFTSKVLIRLGNVNDSENQLIQIPPKGQLSFATPGLDTWKYDSFLVNKNSGWFSGDSMWFSIPFCAQTGPDPFDRHCYTRIFNVSNPAIFHDIDSGSEPQLCNWHEEKSWLLCRAFTKISVIKMIGKDMAVYRYPYSQFPIRNGFAIDWFEDFIAPVSSFRTSLYDPFTGQLSHQLEGTHFFLYSPVEKLLITSESIIPRKYIESLYEHKLYFYDKNLELQGSKTYIYYPDSKIDRFNQVPPQLSGLYDFLLSYPSQELDDLCLFDRFGIDYKPERKYLLIGDWLVVVTFPEPLTNYPDLEWVNELFERHKQSSSCVEVFGCKNEDLVNTIVEYYYFPKPEVQE